MNSAPPTFEKITVRAAAKLSGLSRHTLRAWEKRYGVVTPNRTKTGHRTYTFQDVEKLRLLHALVESGYSIGKLARLNSKALFELKSQTPLASIEPMVRALEKFDFYLLDQHFQKSRLTYSPRDFVFQIAAPLLEEIGLKVAVQEFDISQEHTLSAYLRNQLGNLLAQAQQAHSNSLSTKKDEKFVFTTREGDLHEFGALLGAVLCATHGYSAQFLGPNTPAQSLATMVKATETKFIVIGATPLPSDLDTLSLEEFVITLLKMVPKSTKIWIGGYCDFNLKNKVFSNRVRHFNSLHEFEAALNEKRSNNS